MSAAGSSAAPCPCPFGPRSLVHSCAEHAAAPAADGALKSRLVAQLGFPADAVDASVAADRPDHVNTTYLLLKRQLERDAPGAGGDDAITEVDEVGVS